MSDYFPSNIAKASFQIKCEVAAFTKYATLGSLANRFEQLQQPLRFRCIESGEPVDEWQRDGLDWAHDFNMKKPQNIQEFYKRTDQIAEQLISLGMTSEGERLSWLLHKVTWNSSSELLPEIASTFRSLTSSDHTPPLPEDLKRELMYYLKTIG